VRRFRIARIATVGVDATLLDASSRPLSWPSKGSTPNG
jgi:hypothetical protein